MTLIVGALCKDGIVMGADGAVTMGRTGKPTVRQPTRKKLTKIGQRGILGVSGPVGLSQRFKNEIEKISNLNSLEASEAMVKIRDSFWGHIQKEIEIAHFMAQRLGQAACFDTALSSSLYASIFKTKLQVMAFDEKGSPELLLDDLPFYSIGSGQDIADTFLSFLKELFWKESKPNVAEGILAILWTLRLAIEVNPGGISEPIQIMTITGSPHVAKELQKDEYADQSQQIDEMKKLLRKYQSDFQDASGISVPPK